MGGKTRRIMSSIIETNQNILNVSNGIICHGVNCQGVMGAGLALAIRNKWPSTYQNYKKYCDRDKTQLLGSVCFDKINPQLCIAHCFTQFNYGRFPVIGEDKKQHFQILALSSCLDIIFEYCQREGMKEIHVPHIGAGIGGGKWDIIKEMILNKAKNWPKDIQLVIHDPP